MTENQPRYRPSVRTDPNVVGGGGGIIHVLRYNAAVPCTLHCSLSLLLCQVST